MNCESAKAQLPAYLDGELDHRAVADLEAHFTQCPECSRELATLEQLRKALRNNLPRYQAPTQLRLRLQRSAAASAETSQPAAYRYWKIAASLLLAYLLGAGTIWYAGNLNYKAEQIFAQSLLNSHLRALVANNPVDVVSSNRHVVKPWFAGRIAIAPPVADFAEEGFPLVGGRIDYVGGERAAVLTYSHAQHLIDVYFLPSSSVSYSASRMNGYTLTPLRIADQTAWMVTDMDEHESGRFKQLIATP